MIKAVIFDIDNTLYSYDHAHEAAWAALCAYAEEHLNMDRAAFTAAHRAAAITAEQRLGAPCAACHNRLLRYQVLLEQAKLPVHPHALAMSELYWTTLLREAHPEPGALACLRALKEEGYLLGIGSDMTLDYQLKKLTKLEMLPLMDFIVTSEEVLTEKPDSKLFALCAEKAGVAAGQCLFIGDSFTRDVLGPEQAGMNAVWYCPDPDKAALHPEVRHISHFDQLTQQLRKGGTV